MSKNVSKKIDNEMLICLREDEKKILKDYQFVELNVSEEDAKEQLNIIVKNFASKLDEALKTNQEEGLDDSVRKEILKMYKKVKEKAVESNLDVRNLFGYANLFF